MVYFNYKKIKEVMWMRYSKIGTVVVPCLNNEKVIFSRVGFNHLIRKNNGTRLLKDQIRRFHLLIYARIVLEGNDSNVIFKSQKDVRFWKITKIIKGKPIKVIIRQKGYSEKHFFSIM